MWRLLVNMIRIISKIAQRKFEDRLLQIKSRFSFESQKKIKEEMKKEGNKMETHQIWIRTSKKTQKRSKSDLNRAKEAGGGGADRWWWCFCGG